MARWTSLARARGHKLRRIGAALFVALFIFSHHPAVSFAAEPAVYRRVSTEAKVIALTFDDGPHPRVTNEILDLLAEYGAKATFFVVGKNLEYYGEAARRAVSEGHELGNHTYSHPHLSEVGAAALEREILKSAELIERLTGVTGTLFRPPEGSCRSEVLSVVKKNGYSTVLWDVDTRDWSGVSGEVIVKNVIKNVREGSIVLFHDYVGRNCHTVAALKEILPRLSAAGYRFVTVSELLSYSTSASDVN